MMISKQLRVLAAMAVLLCAASCVKKDAESGAAGAAAPAGESQPFELARVQFEQNATDGDVEVVFEAQAGVEGLASLVVKGPDGRTAVNVTAPDTSTMGIRQFRYESPETKDAASLKGAYPEGVYTFTGVTVSGKRFEGSSTLSQQVPSPGAFLQPAADAENVSVHGLVLKWSPVSDVAAYIVSIEQEELQVSITARLSASATSFAVPDGFLAPGTKYIIGLGAVTKSENATYVEAEFTTAAK